MSTIFIRKAHTDEEKAKDTKVYEKDLKNNGYEECLEGSSLRLVNNKIFIKKINPKYSSIGVIVVQPNNQATVMTINDSDYKIPEIGGR